MDEWHIKAPTAVEAAAAWVRRDPRRHHAEWSLGYLSGDPPVWHCKLYRSGSHLPTPRAAAVGRTQEEATAAALGSARIFWEVER